MLLKRPCAGHSNTIARNGVENTALLTMAQSCSNIGLSDRPALIERFTYPQRRIPGVKPVTRRKNCLEYRPGRVARWYLCAFFYTVARRPLHRYPTAIRLTLMPLSALQVPHQVSRLVLLLRTGRGSVSAFRFRTGFAG